MLNLTSPKRNKCYKYLKRIFHNTGIPRTLSKEPDLDTEFIYIIVKCVHMDLLIGKNGQVWYKDFYKETETEPN